MVKSTIALLAIAGAVSTHAVLPRGLVDYSYSLEPPAPVHLSPVATM